MKELKEWMMRAGWQVAVASLGLACAAFAPIASAGQRGALIGSVPVTLFTKAAIDQQVAAMGPVAQQLIGAARCDVKLQFISYTSAGPKDSSVLVSGALLVPLPSATCPIRASAHTLSYSHGTRFMRASTLANPLDPETQLVAAVYAAQGIIVVASDLIGYFGSTFPYHPYLHTRSEADATIDALRASRTLLRRSGITMASLVVAGYSQGGHTAMATQRLLESQYPTEFPLVASTPMSGPYALEKTILDATVQPTLFSSAYGAFVIVAMNRVYGKIYDEPIEAFQSLYAWQIEKYMPGPLELLDLYAAHVVPENLLDLLQPKFVADARADENHPLRKALRTNTLLEWKPKAPVVLCGGARDPIVPFFNTQLALESFLQRGAPARMIEVDAALNLPDFTSQQDVIDYHPKTVSLACMALIRIQLYGGLL
ncbi:MAG TPA: lipase family protein [Burkholderiales bacterium]|nr:lipase family protein [Burkholderiales bacterium]